MLLQKMEQNHEWESIKSTIIESAKEIIETRERHTATSGGMKNAKTLSQRQTMLERNVYKKELDQTKYNKHK
jgi:hypothetical protein